jgi:hypothetical protein
MKNQKGTSLSALLSVIVWVLSAVGWVCNIITLAQSNFDHITGLIILRVIGVFVAPLGSVLGFVA